MELVSRKSFICLSVLICSVFLSGKQTHDSDWFDYALRAEPISFDSLDGALISRFAMQRTGTPLIYSSIVPLHTWMDRTAKTFYTLRQLSENPRLAQVKKDRQFAIKVPNIQKKGDESFTFTQRQSKLFDPSALLLPEKSTPLPDDKELNDFLSAKGSYSVSPEKQMEIIKAMLKEKSPDHPVLSLISNLPAQETSFSNNKHISTGKNLPKKPKFFVPEPPNASANNKISAESEKYLTSTTFPKNTILKLKAQKPSRDGTLKPAQASEIYLTTQDLKELLKDLTQDPAIAGEVRSVAELWAKAEKDVSRNPEIALGVKSILLSAKVGRARTDPYGQASMENLSPDDKYYVIGIDKDIETDVVTIWSKEVKVAPGENLVELSSTDIIYQE